MNIKKNYNIKSNINDKKEVIALIIQSSSSFFEINNVIVKTKEIKNLDYIVEIPFFYKNNSIDDLLNYFIRHKLDFFI